jgi:hypothetical protein
MKFFKLAAIATLIVSAPLAATAATVSMSTSGGVVFSAANPSLQPITPATTSLVATVTMNGVKAGETWNMKIRGLGSDFTGTSGSPISISNAHWTAIAVVLDGRGTVTASSGSRDLSTSDITVASGSTGNRSPFIVQVIFTFTFTNSWTYDADTFLQTLVLTSTTN